MQNKYILITVICIGFFIYALMSKQTITTIEENPVIKTQIKIEPKPRNIQRNIQQDAQDIIISETVTAPIIRGSTSDDWFISEELAHNMDLVFDVISQQRYSTDPFIEFLSIIADFKQCKKSNDLLRGVDSGKIKDLLKESLKKDCEVLIETKKLFEKIKNKKKLITLFSSKEMQSPYSTSFIQLSEGGMSSEKDEYVFNLALKSKSPQLMSLESFEFKSKLFKQLISQQLETINKKYIKIIGSQALQRFACRYQQGVTCKNTSRFMLMQCESDSQLCGKDNDYWFNHYISTGHKADLEIVLELLQNL